MVAASAVMGYHHATPRLKREWLVFPVTLLSSIVVSRLAECRVEIDAQSGVSSCPWGKTLHSDFTMGPRRHPALVAQFHKRLANRIPKGSHVSVNRKDERQYRKPFWFSENFGSWVMWKKLEMNGEVQHHPQDRTGEYQPIKRTAPSLELASNPFVKRWTKKTNSRASTHNLYVTRGGNQTRNGG